MIEPFAEKPVDLLFFIRMEHVGIGVLIFGFKAGMFLKVENFRDLGVMVGADFHDDFRQPMAHMRLH